MPPSTPPHPTDVTFERVYATVIASVAFTSMPIFEPPLVRAAVAALAVGATALHAATHSPSCRGRVTRAACALRWCAAATGQYAISHVRRLRTTTPASILSFLLRRNQPMLHFGSAATLRTRTLAAYLAVIGGELSIYVVMQAGACRGILTNLPGTAWFYDKIAATIHAVALAPVVGSAAAEGATCAAAGCGITQTFCFAAASPLGAAASSCGGTARVSPAGVCVGVYACAVLAVVVARLEPCPPLPPWHVAVLAAGQPAASILERGRLRFHVRLILEDVATVAGVVGVGVRDAARALFFCRRKVFRRGISGPFRSLSI